MLLTNFNITEQLTEQINQYLSNNTLTFSEIKALILSKAPLPHVHSNIVKMLTESRDANRIKVQKALETHAHKNQLLEDEKQKKHDVAEESKDDELKRRLNRELKQIPTQISSHETECRLIQRKITRLIEAPPKVEVTQKQSTSSKRSSTSDFDEYNRTIEKLRNSLMDYELKIQTLLREQHTLQIKLKEIEERSEIRDTHRYKRIKRAQATLGYSKTGEGIEETLSTKNRNLLTKSIQDQHNALDKKCADLIQDSEQINYPYFLEQLQTYLNKSRLKLTNQEIDALKAIIKLMHQHLEFEHQAVNTETSLKIKKQSISNQITKLNGFNSKLRSLQESNPSLNSANLKLATHNLELTASSEEHIRLRDKLGIPALLLFSLTFIFCIPLILTISGVIPFFIAPALLYSLVAIPPAALFIATLGVGIAALVYSIKAHMDDSAIKANLQTIDMNTSLMGRNNQSLKTLETVTIPSLNSQIKKDETARDNLILSLKNLQNQASQAFKQAKEIEPVLLSDFPVFATKDKVLSKSSSSISDKSEDQDDSLESISEELETSGYSPN